jgi:hypothetical protein
MTRHKLSASEEAKVLSIIKRELRSVKNMALQSFLDELIAGFDGNGADRVSEMENSEAALRYYHRTTQDYVYMLMNRVKDVVNEDVFDMEEELKNDIEGLKEEAKYEREGAREVRRMNRGRRK